MFLFALGDDTKAVGGSEGVYYAIKVFSLGDQGQIASPTAVAGGQLGNNYTTYCVFTCTYT